MRRAFAPLALAIGAALLPAAALADESAAAAVTRTSRPAVVTRTSRPVRLLRVVDDSVKGPGGKEYRRRVELVFDYRRGVALENYYTPDRRLYASREIKYGLPRPSAEEIAEASDLVRTDRFFTTVFSRFPEAVVEGGFVLEEGRGKPCGPGHRCLQLQVRTSYYGELVRRVVVDLVSRTVPYKDHTPTRTGVK